MRDLFQAGNGGFHKIYFSRSFLALSLGSLGTLCANYTKESIQSNPHSVSFESKKSGYQGVIAKWRTERRGFRDSFVH